MKHYTIDLGQGLIYMAYIQKCVACQYRAKNSLIDFFLFKPSWPKIFYNCPKRSPSLHGNISYSYALTIHFKHIGIVSYI